MVTGTQTSACLPRTCRRDRRARRRRLAGFPHRHHYSDSSQLATSLRRLSKAAASTVPPLCPWSRCLAGGGGGEVHDGCLVCLPQPATPLCRKTTDHAPAGQMDDQSECVLVYVSRTKCLHYRNHHHDGAAAGLVIPLSLAQFVHGICIMARINELGLLPANVGLPLLNDAVRRLRGVTRDWDVVSTEELLCSVARQADDIRFNDNGTTAPPGSLTAALTTHRGFPCISSSGDGLGVFACCEQLEQGRLLLEAFMAVAALLPAPLLPVPGAAAEAAGRLLSSVKGHRMKWDGLKSRACDCGTV